MRVHWIAVEHDTSRFVAARCRALDAAVLCTCSAPNEIAPWEPDTRIDRNPPQIDHCYFLSREPSSNTTSYTIKNRERERRRREQKAQAEDRLRLKYAPRIDHGSHESKGRERRDYMRDYMRRRSAARKAARLAQAGAKGV